MGAAGAGQVGLVPSDLRGSDLELRVGEGHKSTGVRAASILVLNGLQEHTYVGTTVLRYAAGLRTWGKESTS